MNKEYSNENTIVIFANNNKTKETSPSHTGTVYVGNEEHRVALWVKTAKNGKKFFSGKINPKEEKPEAPKPSESAEEESFDESDMPF